MSSPPIRLAYRNWPSINQALTKAVAELTEAQLAIKPSPERWPLWATVGHLACQRVSGLCGFAGEPGADQTPFPNALYRCPGDEYLEPAMSADELVGALGSTFRVVESCLDRWTLATLDEEIERTFGAERLVHTRGWLIQRAFAHDVWHTAELNEALTNAGLPPIDIWA